MMKNKLRKQALVSCSALMLMGGVAVVQAASLFSETFDGVTSGYIIEGCGTGCSHSVQHGVPVTGGGTTVSGGSDEDWYGVRFESVGNTSASIVADIGVQETGGSGDNTPVGLLSADAGIMFKLDASNYENLSLEFDWTTFRAGSGDKVTVGYFVGDLDGIHPDGMVDRTLDARNELHYNFYETPTRTDLDGDWNWNGDALLDGNQGAWVELMNSGSASLDWHYNQSFDLALADGQSEVWVAFWLDNGNDDFGKIDNITVTADLSAVPVPAAVWLLGSGLLAFVGIARRKNS